MGGYLLSLLSLSLLMEMTATDRGVQPHRSYPARIGGWETLFSDLW